MKEFVEVESGKNADQAQAGRGYQGLAWCMALSSSCAGLAVRDAHSCLGLEKASIDFVCADMPNANKLTVRDHGFGGGEERRVISKRNKDRAGRG